MKSQRLGWVFLFVFFTCLAFTVSAQAATLTLDVTTTNDENDNAGGLSLREALVIANTGLDDYVINLQAGAIYKLMIPPTPDDDGGGSRGDLNVYRDGMTLTINGNGAVIDATGNNSRIFRVADINGTSGINVNFTINDLTLMKGKSDSSGGAINVNGKGNSTTLLTLNHCHVTGNEAVVFGGGIAAQLATVTLNRSTVSANITAANGGGVSVVMAALRLNNSTVSGNQAKTGGGLNVGQASAIVRSSTISKNTATGLGGGVAGGEGSLSLKNTILSGNIGTGGDPECQLSSMSLDSQGYNVFGTLSGNCPVTGPKTGDQTNVTDPKLSDLSADNGSLITPTQYPQPDSPAVDKGDPAGCTDTADAPLTTDQRGSNRNIDGDGNGSAVCDVGAVERDRCGDGQVTGAEQCESGVCCDTGFCKFKASNTACDDGNASTTNDVCNASGACQGTAPTGGGNTGGVSGGGCALERGEAGSSSLFFLMGFVFACLLAMRRPLQETKRPEGKASE